MLEELKNENVKFKKMSEEEAIKYLEQNNNYRNICLYKNLFEKYYIDGKYVNKYIDLDFAYLKHLTYPLPRLSDIILIHIFVRVNKINNICLTFYKL